MFQSQLTERENKVKTCFDHAPDKAEVIIDLAWEIEGESISGMGQKVTATMSLLVLGDAHPAEVQIEFLWHATLVEQVFAVEHNDVG